MIVKKDLKLLEVEADKFFELMSTMYSVPRVVRSPGQGFCHITSPLTYPTFHELLSQFLGTPDARCISFCVGSPPRWRKIDSYLIDDDAIGSILAAVEKSGRVYLHFNDHPTTNHEIGFRRGSDLQVTSTYVCLPFYRLDDYSFEGTGKKYHCIDGLWVPNISFTIAASGSLQPCQSSGPRPDLSPPR